MFKPGENMLCTEIVSEIQKNFCTCATCSPHVLQKRRASDKDLPVTNTGVSRLASDANIIVLVCQMASIASVPIEASYDGRV